MNDLIWRKNTFNIYLCEFYLTKQITAYGDHTDVAKALLAYGADINALDSKGYSPLMVAGKKSYRN